MTGIGTISGTECVIVANDPTVKGGARDPFGAKGSACHGHRAAEPASR